MLAVEVRIILGTSIREWSKQPANAKCKHKQIASLGNVATVHIDVCDISAALTDFAN